MKPADRARFEQSASPEAIEKRLAQLRRTRAAALEETKWLERLLVQRCRNIAAGIWPPKNEGPTAQERKVDV